MGNDMFNEEQLAYAAEQQASRERNPPPEYILSREAFLRRLHILADTRPSNDGLIPSEVDLSAHDAALRAENARLRGLLRQIRNRAAGSAWDMDEEIDAALAGGGAAAREEKEGSRG